jgi:asparagine synthase (glutamine-hydrolysing)
MCGIYGLFYFDSQKTVEEPLLTGMREIAAHRGPDDRGIYRSRNVGLAANRLSIVDIPGGHQPMASDDGTVRLVFNGEIYNFGELRTELIRAGHSFRTRSDTETLLRAWEEYGEDCVTRLRGMFAFVIWDEKRQVLFGARDRIGIKPFYYYSDRKRFAFASEIKSLLQIPDIPQQVDTSALADYLRHGCVLTPHTLFRSIHKLPPAHTITVNQSGATIRRYWEVPFDNPRHIGERQALEEFAGLLDETIRMHLVSDVPLGAFLSGGIDSSSIVAMASRANGRPLKTFSIGYDSGESELNYARVVAEHCRTEHREIRLTASHFRDLLPNIVWHMDEPIADAPSVALFCLSQLARGEVTVALSGEGSDEILGGYPTYNRMLAFDQINRLPFMRLAGRAFERWAPAGKLRKNGSMLGLPLQSRYRTAVVFSVEEISRLMPDQDPVDDPYGSLEKIHRRSQSFGALARMSYVDLNSWLPNDLLLKTDRMGMAHSLELRVPFLDHKLVEFAARLPAELKIRHGRNKYLLKQLMQPLLPPQILRRGKKGFPLPIKSWLRESLAGFAREKLLAGTSPCVSFFARAEIERVLDAHRYRDCGDQIFALLVFDEWYRTFIEPQNEPDRVTSADRLGNGRFGPEVKAQTC